MVARADGPHIAFHGTSGPYAATVFSAPDPLVTGPVDLNILVQRADDGSLVRSAQASGQLTLPGHAPIQFVFVPGGPLPAATVPLPDPGMYVLTLEIAVPGAAPLHFEGSLPVEANHGTRDTVAWAVTVPVLLILLFLLNQYAKGQMRAGYRKAVSPVRPGNQA